jgi:hypothetical protein
MVGLLAALAETDSGNRSGCRSLDDPGVLKPTGGGGGTGFRFEPLLLFAGAGLKVPEFEAGGAFQFVGAIGCEFEFALGQAGALALVLVVALLLGNGLTAGARLCDGAGGGTGESGCICCTGCVGGFELLGGFKLAEGL